MAEQIKIGGRLHSIAEGNVTTGANEILDDSKGKKQSVINQETDAELERLNNAKQDNLTFDTTPTEGSTNPITSGGVYAADAALQQAIEAILLLIPSAASALNQLADKNFVNSTVATDSATFRGTYNVVTDLELHYDATHQQIATALLSKIQTADNNDYCFVQIPVSDSSGDIRVTERYKFNGTVWGYEYDLNNSGFTAAQWAAINSTITQALVEKLGALPTAADLAIALNGKQNTLTFDTAPVAGSNNPVTSGGLYAAFAAINATIPAGASVDNKLVAETRLAEYIAAIINALDATYNVTSTDGHVNVRLTQVDGVITSLEVLTSDIASAADVTALTIRVSTNEGDIALLQDAYEALTQSTPVIVEPTDTWPVAAPQEKVIYRVIDRVNTPPQNYSDYMYNGTAMVLMATYDNAIDDIPTPGSNNLVKSGGVASHIVYDISEANAVGSTLATYADLAAALGNNGANIPPSIRKGGMQVKFIQGSVGSSDNNYVQYRCIADDFTTDVTKWQLSTLPFDVTSDGVISEEPLFVYDKITLVKDSTSTKYVNLADGSLSYGGNYYFSSVYDVSGLRGKLIAIATSTSSNTSAIGLFKNNVCVYRTNQSTNVKKTDVVELTDTLDADTLYVSYQQTNVNEDPLLYIPQEVVTIKDLPYKNTEEKVLFEKDVVILNEKTLERKSTSTKFVYLSDGSLLDGGGYYFSSVYDVSGLRGLLTATATSNSSSIPAIGLFRGNVCVYHTAEASNTKPTDSVELTDTMNADTLYVGYIVDNENDNPSLVRYTDVVTEDEIKKEIITVTATRNQANYNSIREIINSITDASENKQYIIYIPKGEWFECDLQGKKYVKLVGEDMQETIIYNDGTSTNLTPSDYSIPSKANMRLCDIDMSYKHCFYGLYDMDVENLTINVYSSKYCVHLDKEGARTAIFKDCKMANDENSLNVVGIGLWAHQDYTFIGCDFIQNNAGQDTSFYMHNWNNQSYIGKLKIEKCRMNKHYAIFNELGAEASTLVYLNDCKSTMANAKVRLGIESNGGTSYWINPSTGQPTTDLTEVPYCIKLNYFGTDCGFIVNENRPNALNYVMG